MVKKAIFNQVLKLRKKIEASGISVSHMLIYGSHARGTERPDSDIDVCVVSPTFKENEFRWNHRRRLAPFVREINPLIEVVAYSEQEFKNNFVSPLLHQIRKEAIEVSSRKSN